MNIISSIKNDEDGTEIYVFDRSEVDAARPFGVRFYDMDSNTTIAVYHCPTMEIANARVATITKDGGAISVAV